MHAGICCAVRDMEWSSPMFLHAEAYAMERDRQSSRDILAAVSGQTKIAFAGDFFSGGFMQKNELPVTCPLCGRKNNFRVEELTEGAIIVCSFCSVELTLHGHMWEDIKKELEGINWQSDR